MFFFRDFVDKSFEKLQTCHNENVERFFKNFRWNLESFKIDITIFVFFFDKLKIKFR